MLSHSQIRDSGVENYQYQSRSTPTCKGFTISNLTYYSLLLYFYKVFQTNDCMEGMYMERKILTFKKIKGSYERKENPMFF